MGHRVGHSTRARTLGLLVRVNLAELVKSLKLDMPLLRPAARLVFRAPARTLSRRLLAMDRLVALRGLPAAMRWFVRPYVREVRVRGAEAPRRGSLIVVSNHPGLSDGPAVIGAVGRDDLRVIAAERDLLRAMPNLSRALFYVSDRHERRHDVLRQAARHLRAGGALLTFPAGEIEPDPALHADAPESVRRWSDSVALLARIVPGTPVVPVVVSGVASREARRHPLVSLYRTRKQREWVAATLQVISRRYRRTTVTVRMGEPLLIAPGSTRFRIMEGIRASVVSLMGVP